MPESPGLREETSSPTPVLPGIPAHDIDLDVPLVTATLAQQWRDWIPKLTAAREAIATLPPIPTSIWLAGGTTVLLVGLFRTLRFRRVLRSGVPARADTVTLVEEAAEALQLGRAPRVLMVADRVSPMIWCGRRPALILPVDLWDELDDTGRRAVVAHELAHLRRRDHWVRWLEVILSVLYWWHPIVWWVRARLRDEADFCCDAWVIAMLPKDRRAYAQALLNTHVYLSESTVAPPIVGLGVTTAGAKRFARRLTMVMKDRAKPGLSVCGLALSVSLAVAGGLTTSLLACPPDRDTAAKPAHGAGAGVATTITRPAQSGPVTIAVPVIAAPDSGTTFEQFVTSGGQPGQDRPARAGQPGERRLDDIERRLDRLDDQLRRLEMLLERQDRRDGPSPFQPQLGRTPRPPEPPRAPQPPRAPIAPMPPTPPTPPPPPDGPMGMGGGPGMAPMPGAAARARNRNDDRTPRPTAIARAAPRAEAGPGQRGAEVARVYQLPPGKLEALLNLMKREDVPILVGAVDNGIEVHGNEQQQRIFRAFIQMINPSEQGGGMRQGGTPGPDPLSNEGALLNRPGTPGTLLIGPDDRHTLEAMAELNAKRAMLADQSAAMQKRAHDLQKQAERVRKEAEKLQSRAEKATEKAERLSGPAQEAAMKQAAEISLQAETVSGQADELEAQAEAVSAEADALSEASDGIQEEMAAAEPEEAAAASGEESETPAAKDPAAPDESPSAAPTADPATTPTPERGR